MEPYTRKRQHDQPPIQPSKQSNQVSQASKQPTTQLTTQLVIFTTFKMHNTAAHIVYCFLFL